MDGSLLVGIAEIAERSNVIPDTVHKWRKRYDDFPKPIAELKAGPIWDWTDVEAWVQRRPGPGRPTARS